MVILGLFKPNVEKMEKSKDVKGLMKALEHRDSGVRMRAAGTLGRIGDEKAVEPLIQALKDKDSGVRLAAGVALGKIGEPAVEPLTQALKDKSSHVRNGSARALGMMALEKIKDARAVEPLIQTLMDEDKDVRSSAAWALGMIGDARAVEPLIQALKDSRYLVVLVEAAKAIGRIGDPRLIMLTEAFGGLKPGLVTAIEIAIEYVTQVLKIENPNAITMAILTLEEIGEPAVEPLIQTLKDENRPVRFRWGAASALGFIGDERAVEPLTQALNDENRDVQEAAKEALERIRDKKSQK